MKYEMFILYETGIHGNRLINYLENEIMFILMGKNIEISFLSLYKNLKKTLIVSQSFSHQ